MPNVKTIEYDHYSEVPLNIWKEWPSRYFHPKEIASHDTGRVLVDLHSLRCLENLRKLIGRPLIVTSGYRTPAHNKAVGGATNSLHMQGKAFDLRFASGLGRIEIIHQAGIAGFQGIGVYDTFVHVDTGRKRYWMG